MPRPEPTLRTPCEACPWRVSNQGKRHKGFYTKRNLTRLWAGLRRGQPMSCHPTDPRHPDHGAREESTPQECSGALLMVIRELYAASQLVGNRFEVTPRATDAYAKVTKARNGLTRQGVFYWALTRAFPKPLGDGQPLPSIPARLMKSPDFARPFPGDNR